MQKQMTERQMHVRIENPGDKLGGVGVALQAALAKHRELELAIEESNLHELACNIAEDLDGGAIFDWRLDQVKEHLRAGGTTGFNDAGEFCLVAADGKLSY